MKPFETATLIQGCTNIIDRTIDTSTCLYASLDSH
jgi:hypothetical protein